MPQCRPLNLRGAFEGATLTSTPMLMMTCTVDWPLGFLKGIWDSDNKKLWLSDKSGSPTHSTRNTWVTPGATIACGGKIRNSAPACDRLCRPYSSSSMRFMETSSASGAWLELITFTCARLAGPADIISSWMGLTDVAEARSGRRWRRRSRDRRGEATQRNHAIRSSTEAA